MMLSIALLALLSPDAHPASSSPAPPASAAASKTATWTFEIGDALPSATLSSLDGAAVTLPGEGSPLLLNVFASWCGPCRMEMPLLEEKIWRVWRAKGLRVAGINRGEPAEAVRPFIRNLGATYPIFLDQNRAFFRKISGDGLGIPKTILVDSKGRVVWRENGFVPEETIPSLEREIVKLLESPGTSSR